LAGICIGPVNDATGTFTSTGWVLEHPDNRKTDKTISKNNTIQNFCVIGSPFSLLLG